MLGPASDETWEDLYDQVRLMSKSVLVSKVTLHLDMQDVFFLNREMYHTYIEVCTKHLRTYKD